MTNAMTLGHTMRTSERASGHVCVREREGAHRTYSSNTKCRDVVARSIHAQFHYMHIIILCCCWFEAMLCGTLHRKRTSKIINDWLGSFHVHVHRYLFERMNLPNCWQFVRLLPVALGVRVCASWWNKFRHTGTRSVFVLCTQFWISASRNRFLMPFLLASPISVMELVIGWACSRFERFIFKQRIGLLDADSVECSD